MTDTNEAPVEASVPTTTPNPANVAQDRIAAAADALERLNPSTPEPVEEPETAEAETEDAPADEPEAKPEPSTEKPRGRRQKAKEGAKPEAKPDGDDDPDAKPRNMMRDLAAEWATARRAQKENQKRAAELAERQAQLEAEAAQAREVAMLMQGNPIKAAERLAQLAGMAPSEYLQKLQAAYIAGQDGESSAATDAVARELAQLRAELQAEKKARADQEHRAKYQQQIQQTHEQETTKLVTMAKHYSDMFPELQRIPEQTLSERVSETVAHCLSNGIEVSRFEVLQAMNKLVGEDLQKLGFAGTVEARASSAPAVTNGKSANGVGQPKTSRNGSHRQIPTNRDAADGGVRRSLTMEERLKEAEKVLWAASKR